MQTDTIGTAPRVPANSRDLSSVALTGALAGLSGGLAMALIAALIAVLLGTDLWLESKQIAAFIYGPAVATQPGFAAGPVLVGSLIHIVVSALLGAVFGVVLQRVWRLPTDLGAPVLLGLVYGLLVWALAYYVVLPLANPALMQTYAPAFIVQHVVYGLVTGQTYSLLRRDPYVPEQRVA